MYEVVNKELERKFKMTHYPLNICMEVTNHCNLNCIMCKHDRMQRKKGYMSMALYKKIIDETARENPNTRIWLDFYGEALLAGWKAYYMIDYAKKQGLRNVCINTNGTLMNHEYAEMLIDSGVDYISLDCDGFSKSVYESIRINADRDVFYRNVEYLLEYKKLKQSKTVVDIKIIEMQKNKNEISTILNYWQARGAWVAVRRCIEWCDTNLNNEKISTKNRIACGQAFGTMAITWDGIVAGCALDYDCSFAFGNVEKESVKSIWIRRNESFLDLHLKHKWEQLPIICRDCTNWEIIGEERYDETGNPVARNYSENSLIYQKGND